MSCVHYNTFLEILQYVDKKIPPAIASGARVENVQFFCIFLLVFAILMIVFYKEDKMMDKQMQKVVAIVAGSVAGAALLGGVFYMIWNSKQAKAMRAVHRTNTILRRVGNVLCKIAAADEACM